MRFFCLPFTSCSCISCRHPPPAPHDAYLAHASLSFAHIFLHLPSSCRDLVQGRTKRADEALCLFAPGGLGRQDGGTGTWPRGTANGSKARRLPTSGCTRVGERPVPRGSWPGLGQRGPTGKVHLLVPRWICCFRSFGSRAAVGPHGFSELFDGLGG